MRDIFDARLALECLAVDTAVQRIPQAALDALADTFQAAAAALARGAEPEATLAPSDSAVHDLIIAYCENAVVRELMDTLSDRLAWVRRLAADRGQSYQRYFEEHQQILAGLQARDAATTVERLHQHLIHARDHTMLTLGGDGTASADRVGNAVAAGGA